MYVQSRVALPGSAQLALPKMYTETMKAIHARLVRKGVVKGHTYTSELLPERQQNGQVYAFVRDAVPVYTDIIGS